jgi:hypothetical protein
MNADITNKEAQGLGLVPAAEEPEPTPLVSVAGLILHMGGPSAFQPEYDWSSATIAEMLLDLNEKVFSYRGVLLIDEDTAAKLEEFLQDFLLQ